MRPAASSHARRVLTGRDADLPPLALLVGLRAPQSDGQAILTRDHVGYVEADQLRAPEGTGEANVAESVDLTEQVARSLLAKINPTEIPPTPTEPEPHAAEPEPDAAEREPDAG